MSQLSAYSQRHTKWQKQSLNTYDCSICVTTNTNQLLELPCGHTLCLSCLYMICAHSILACPYCRCRLSTWLRRNPDYSKLIIKQQSTIETKEKKKTSKQKLKRVYQTSRKQPTLDEYGNICDDWILAEKLYYQEFEKFRYNYGRITRSMSQKMKI